MFHIDAIIKDSIEINIAAIAILTPPNFKSLNLIIAYIAIKIVKYDIIGTIKEIIARMNAKIAQSGVLFFIIKFYFKVLNNFLSLEQYTFMILMKV